MFMHFHVFCHSYKFSTFAPIGRPCSARAADLSIKLMILEVPCWLTIMGNADYEDYLALLTDLTKFDDIICRKEELYTSRQKYFIA